VFVNRGAQAPGELPRDVWFADHGGDVAEPAQAFLVAAPAFGTYLDVVEVELHSVPERGQLFFGRLQEGALEVLGQVRLDAKRRVAHQIQPVEGRVLDAVDGKPLPGAQVTLKGATDWRPDRSVVQQVVVGPEGRFAFPRVEPGRYVLETRQDTYLGDQRVLVQATAPTRLDVRLAPVPPLAGYIGVRLRRHDRGIIVEEVVRHSGAERAGILPGDRIVSVGGERVTTMDRIHELIPGKPGTRARLRLERKGRFVDVAAIRAPLLRDRSNEAP
jgi:membrane-associated protease RseP (regulator of RpoE activity)